MDRYQMINKNAGDSSRKTKRHGYNITGKESFTIVNYLKYFTNNQIAIYSLIVKLDICCFPLQNQVTIYFRFLLEL